jgi:DNA-binding NtrC family response regulator
MPTSQRAAKVLVVDDEPDMADSIRHMLERYGHQVVVETNSTRAVQLAVSEQPDLVITDLRMPDLDGLELLDRLRASNMNMPVIIITGYASIDAASRAQASGAADFFTKPFSPDELRSRVEKALRLA